MYMYSHLADLFEYISSFTRSLILLSFISWGIISIKIIDLKVINSLLSLLKFLFCLFLVLQVIIMIVLALEYSWEVSYEVVNAETICIMR